MPLLLYGMSLFAQMPQYKLAQLGLTGNVQSVTERTGECIERFGEYTFANNEVLYKIMFFNPNGMLTSEKWEENGHPKMLKYIYSSNKITVTGYKEDGTVEASWDVMLTPKSASNKSYSYFDNGSVKSENFLDEFGNVFEKYTYNIKGQITERRKYKEGIAKDVFSYTYDAKGNLLSMTRTRTGGYVVGIATYEYKKYDSLGNWIVRIEYQQEGGVGEKVATNITTRMIEYY